jgi:hypothetical protein
MYGMYCVAFFTVRGTTAARHTAQSEVTYCNKIYIIYCKNMKKIPTKQEYIIHSLQSCYQHDITVMCHNDNDVSEDYIKKTTTFY